VLTRGGGVLATGCCWPAAPNGPALGQLVWRGRDGPGGGGDGAAAARGGWAAGLGLSGRAVGGVAGVARQVLLSIR